MIIDSHQKTFVMEMQLELCFARAKAFRLKKIKCQILTAFFCFSKKAKCVKKCQHFQIWFKNARFVTLHATSDCMRPLLLGRHNYCITRPGIGPPWLSKEICTVCFVVCLQFLEHYLILLDLQLHDFLESSFLISTLFSVLDTDLVYCWIPAVIAFLKSCCIYVWKLSREMVDLKFQAVVWASKIGDIKKLAKIW